MSCTLTCRPGCFAGCSHEACWLRPFLSLHGRAVISSRESDIKATRLREGRSEQLTASFQPCPCVHMFSQSFDGLRILKFPDFFNCFLRLFCRRFPYILIFAFFLKMRLSTVSNDLTTASRLPQTTHICYFNCFFWQKKKNLCVSSFTKCEM